MPVLPFINGQFFQSIITTKYYWLLEMEKQFFIIEPKCDFCDDLGHTEDECPKRPKCDYCDERG